MSIYRGIGLTIAGSDSGGGAGIQADLKTFAALKIFGTSVIVALTAQNSLGVQGVFNVPVEMVKKQMDSVLTDFSVGAAKTGMLSDPALIEGVCEKIREYGIQKLVVDPVMVAQSGDPLISKEAISLLKEKLLPLALMVTPNIPEAKELTGLHLCCKKDMEKAARAIGKMGPQAVLVKGGHLEEDRVRDVLFYKGEIIHFEDARIPTQNTHGTGCTLSAAITAELAAGCDLEEAVDRARKYLLQGLKHSFQPGSGPGPLGHAVQVDWV